MLILALLSFSSSSEPYPAKNQVWGDYGKPVDLLSIGKKLLMQLDSDSGVYHASEELWATKDSSFHIFATNRTEPCHFHPATTFATTLSGEGGFRVPYRSIVRQAPGSSFFIPAGKPHSFGPAPGYMDGVIVTVLWSPPFHSNFTIPIDGCIMGSTGPGVGKITS